jgi:hypothetical protein
MELPVLTRELPHSPFFLTVTSSANQRQIRRAASLNNHSFPIVGIRTEAIHAFGHLLGIIRINQKTFELIQYPQMSTVKLLQSTDLRNESGDIFKFMKVSDFDGRKLVSFVLDNQVLHESQIMIYDFHSFELLGKFKVEGLMQRFDVSFESRMFSCWCFMHDSRLVVFEGSLASNDCFEINPECPYEQIIGQFDLSQILICSLPSQKLLVFSQLHNSSSKLVSIGKNGYSWTSIRSAFSGSSSSGDEKIIAMKYASNRLFVLTSDSKVDVYTAIRYCD